MVSVLVVAGDVCVTVISYSSSLVKLLGHSPVDWLWISRCRVQVVLG